jgi:cobalt-zinc-cadmium efflux system outer membrane protein
MSIFPMGRLFAGALAAGLLGLSPAHAADPVNSAPLTLPQAIERAWSLQPEAQALPQRRDAALAERRAANAWTPEAPALELALRSDRLNARQGAREVETGLAVPLWLPGERQRSQSLAEAKLQGTEAQLRAAQWRLAQTLRDAWWQLQRQRGEAEAAAERTAAAQALAQDVSQRVRLGELSRADQHQADAATAAARAEAALAQAQAVAAEQALRALLGMAPHEALLPHAGPEPLPDSAAADLSEHPALLSLRAQTTSSRSAAALARVQSRGNPELTLLQTRERGARGESSTGSLTLALRLPLGSSDRHRALEAQALAEQAEAQARLDQEPAQLQAALHSAQAALAAARSVLEASSERARLALESRSFFDKSFRLGQTDLPTRLRIEQEANTALREQARARINLHHATALLRQALGLLPDQAN